MGSFYGSVQIKTTDRDRVRSALEHLAKGKRRFLLGPALNGWVGVYPDGGGQDLRFAKDLALQLGGELIAPLCHDDSIFSYEYFRDGERIDQYNSIPDYFCQVSKEEKQQLAGRPETFAHLASNQKKFANVAKRMAAQGETPDVFTSNLFEEFAEALGIRNAATSYEYMKENEETDGIVGWKRFIHIPDLSEEKAKKKAARAAIVNQKKLLTKQGRLLAECGGLRGFASPSPYWCVAPDGHGFLVVWSSHADRKEERRPIELYGPPWSGIPQATTWSISPRVYGMELSPSCRYLAVGHAAGDWNARLWDLEENRLIAESTQVRNVSSVGFLADESAMYSVSSFNGEGRIIITPVGPGEPRSIHMPTAKLAAAHPNGESLVVADHDNRLSVLNLASDCFVRSHAIGGEGSLEKQLIANFLALRAKLGSGSPQELTSEQLEQIGANIAQSVEDARKKIENMMGKTHQNLAGQPVVKPERGAEMAFRLLFDPDGKWLFVATSAGVRVYAWRDVLEAQELHPKLSVDLPVTTIQTDEGEHRREGYVYDLDYDSHRNRLLFAGLDGRVRFLDLDSGKSEVLLVPPELAPIHHLGLSRDSATLALTCSPDFDSRKVNKRGPLLQFWNYEAINEG